MWDATPLEAELLVQADRLVGGDNAVLVIDDTALPKKGNHSVGVAAQYASALGKTANCQTLVSATLASGEVPSPMRHLSPACHYGRDTREIAVSNQLVAPGVDARQPFAAQPDLLRTRNDARIFHRSFLRMAMQGRCDRVRGQSNNPLSSIAAVRPGTHRG